MIVFNRWGQVVFRTRDWKKGWDGRIKGELQPTGVYVWLLRYTARDTKKKVEQKGTVTLVR
jgi:gliding motility-associated-like protein